MKRTPIQRRTALRVKSPMARGVGPVRRTRVKPRSVKRQADMVERRALVVRLLAERPRCEARVVCNGAKSTDIDEIKSRAAGGSFLDEANCQALCRACHSWKHEHPQEAHDLGLLKWSHED